MLPQRPRLIVNADDFGYTEGVNRAVLELHGAGVLSSATLMATGRAFDTASEGLLDEPPHGPGARHLELAQAFPGSGRLGIGCHVVLVDGTSVLPPEELPSLAYPPAGRASGHASFRPTLGGFVTDLLRGRIRESEIEHEAIAQIHRLQARGIPVTHLDTHKHTHMFPRVLRPLLRAALQCGVKAIRNPFEPPWSVRATRSAPPLRRAQVRLLAMLRPEFVRLVAEAGLHTTDGALGVLATGSLDGPTLEQLLSAALSEASEHGPQQTWELVCHPGYHDAALSAQPTRLLAAREVERAALLGVKSVLERFRLIHFGELPM